MLHVTVIALLLGLLTPAAWGESAVERGRYLVEVLGACGNCHTPKGPAGEIPDKHLAGGFTIEEAFGVAVTPNITPDTRTGIGSWSDGEIVRAIREGKRRDGRTLGPPMPYFLYRKISDTDVAAIVAYLRTVKPVENVVERSRYTITLPSSYGPPVRSVPEPPAKDLVKYGAYLAGPIAHCADCHTPRTETGQADRSRLFAGGFRFKGPWGTSYAANLTPDRETGIGRYSDAQIVAGLYGAHADGRPVLPPMPSAYYAGKIRQADIQAIIAYLRSLAPIRNVVPVGESAKR